MDKISKVYEFAKVVNMKKVLLYSGGMDSWLISKLWKPDVKLFVDIGTNSSNAEMLRLPKDVVVARFRDLGLWELPQNFILPMRNIYLLTMASNYGEHIMLGATSTDECHDKTDMFALHMENLLNYAWQKQKWTNGKKIKVDFSYRKYSKGQLLKMYVDAGYPWQKAYKDTFSCYTPVNNNECHNCRPCFLKLMAFVDNNFIPNKDVLKTYVPYIKQKLSEYRYVWGDRLYSKEDYIHVLKLAN